jgi:hypothetical protein
MAERERFAHRRGAELVDFEHAGRRRTIKSAALLTAGSPSFSSTDRKRPRSSSLLRRARSFQASAQCRPA